MNANIWRKFGLERLYRLQTCGVDWSFVSSWPGPLEQSHGIIHIVSRPRNLTCCPDRLLYQPQEVCWARCLPPHTVKAPVMCGEVRHMNALIHNIFSNSLNDYYGTLFFNYRSISQQLNTHSVLEYLYAASTFALAAITARSMTLLLKCDSERKSHGLLNSGSLLILGIYQPNISSGQ